MSKTLAIHQPEFCPYVGFFNKMFYADEFVILDDVQFKKNNYQNRNKIFLGDNEKWLTIPVSLENHLETTIRDINISGEDWERRVHNLLYQAYHKEPYYSVVNDELHYIFNGLQSNSILELNMSIICYIRSYLRIETPIVFSSSLGINSSKSDLVLDICKARGADSYLSGIGGKTYLDTEKFKESDIALRYPERVDEYNLSIIDLMMRYPCNEVSQYVRTFARYYEEV